MLVELDIFSGRPNPRWELDERDRAELQRLQAALAPARGAPPEPPGLGYKGFSYGDASGHCRAFQGHVECPDGPLADPSFSVERFLLDRLPAEFAPLRDRIAASLA
ncbi:MAG: hypothetical protein JO276_09175 [Sphingomonadaceae bacterium]|nr:hypothetical protein [Sphingomonadaceae bacterium]